MNLSTEAKKRRRTLALFLGLSALLHVVLALTLRYLDLSTPPPPPAAVFVDLDPATTAPKKTGEREKPKQIAESEVSPDKREPDKAKYLSERTQRVEQETHAKAVDSFRSGGAPSRRGNKGHGLTLSDLAPRSNVLQPPTAEEMEGYRVEKQRQALADAGLPGDMVKDDKGSASNDFLKDVNTADRTMLNTKEFVYFGYYRRIRQKLEAAWNTRLRNTLDNYVYGGRHLAGDRNYVTGLVVVLDRNGSVVRVQVLQQSGAHDLDQAAIDAFNLAGPFPDPPAGLVDEKGEIQIPWNFVLQS